MGVQVIYKCDRCGAGARKKPAASIHTNTIPYSWSKVRVITNNSPLGTTGFYMFCGNCTEELTFKFAMKKAAETRAAAKTKDKQFEMGTTEMSF